MIRSQITYHLFDTRNFCRPLVPSNVVMVRFVTATTASALNFARSGEVEIWNAPSLLTQHNGTLRAAAAVTLGYLIQDTQLILTHSELMDTKTLVHHCMLLLVRAERIILTIMLQCPSELGSLPV